MSITLPVDDWDAIIEAADCGLPSLDPAPQKKAWALVDEMERQKIAALQREGR